MDREIAIGLGTGNRSSATAASQSCTKYFALIGSEILNPKVVAEEAKRVIPKFHLHDFDAQQGRETERLCRIDNGAGDILSSEPQTVDSGTSQIRAAQFRLTHLHISEIATPENTAPKICTIKIRVFEIAALELGILKYRKTALRISLVSTG